VSGAHLESGFTALEDGRAYLHGTPAALCRWFDDQFLRMALEAGATECRFPSAIPRETLARAGFIDAFPGGATALAAHAGAADYFLCPAVCYHVYAWLAGTRLDVPATLTAAHTCFREADRAAAGRSRLWEFTMREVIFVGSADWVTARRDEWARRIETFAAGLQLRGAIEPATDLFFGDVGRGKRLVQQIKGLKLELRVECDDARVAVASFNRHETFFSSRFAFTLGGDGDAHSACVAFGIERWALAFLDQRGAAAAAALVAAS
jgi:seryl-tRNA synthetase